MVNAMVNAMVKQAVNGEQAIVGRSRANGQRMNVRRSRSGASAALLYANRTTIRSLVVGAVAQFLSGVSLLFGRWL